MSSSKNAGGKRRRTPADLLLSPWAVLFGMGSGCAAGIYLKTFSNAVSIFGDIFLAFLMMCTLPIIVSGVVGSLGRMFHSGHMSRDIKRLLLLFLLTTVLTGLVAYLAGLVVRPGASLSEENRSVICEKAFAQEDNGVIQQSDKTKPFWLTIVPPNVFEALSRGSIMGVLFFSILLGVSIGIQRTNTGETIINIMDSVFNACQLIIEWGMYFLPFGLFCLIASQVSRMGMQIILAMGGFILVCFISSVAMILINNFYLARVAGMPYFKVLKALREALTISFATSNVFAAIPSSLLGLQQEMKLDPDRTNLVIPFGATLCNPGAIIYFVASVVFFCNIYNVSPVTDNAWMIIIFGSVAASLGTAGGGAGIYGLLAVLFDPLNLPLNVALPVLLAVDRFVYPILTMADTHLNCTIAAILSNSPKTAESKPPEA